MKNNIQTTNIQIPEPSQKSKQYRRKEINGIHNNKIIKLQIKETKLKDKLYNIYISIQIVQK